MDFNFSKSNIDKYVEYGAEGIVGLGAALWQSTMQYNTDLTNYPIFGTSRLGDLISHIVGTKLANQIMKTVWPNMPTITSPQKINPMGFLNKTVFIGIAAAIINSIIKENVSQYKRMAIIPALVDGAVKGAIIGGAFGGIFDPAPGQYGPSNQAKDPGLNLPFARAQYSDKATVPW